MTKRECVKWQPFNALIPGSKMVNDVLKEKNKIPMPSLSDDQIADLESHLLEAYYNQNVIKLKFYRNGRYYLKQGRIKKIDKNPSKYLAKDTISNLKEPHKSLVNSKPYILATQIFKLGSGLIAAAPKAMITATGVPYIMNTVFPQKQNNPTFKGKNDKVVREIGHIIDNKKIQDFSKKYQNSNFPMHITALTDILTTGIFVQQTYKNQKIDNNRKKTLAYNAEISTGLSLISAYTVDKALSKPTERFIEKFSKLNKGQPNLEKQIEGIKIAKPILILAGIYYTAIPLLSTFIADRVGIRK